MYNNERSASFNEKLRAFLEPTSTRIIIVIMLAVVFLALPIFLGIYNARFSAEIRLTVAPSDAKVMIGDKTAHPGDTVRVEPGKYTIVVKRMGFFSYAEEVDLAEGDKMTVLTALESSDESTANWYEEHPEDEEIASGIASAEYIEGAEEFAKKYAISAVLPIFEDFYRIDYGECHETAEEFCIYITSLAGARTTASNRLMGLSGYDAAEYRIEYLQYFNPFIATAVAPNAVGEDISDLAGAWTVLNGLIAPFNANGYSFSVLSVEQVDEEYPGYAIGKIVHNLSDGGKNTYKVILQLQENGWVIVAMPKLVYSYLDYPNLPKEVIYEANH